MAHARAQGSARIRVVAGLHPGVPLPDRARAAGRGLPEDGDAYARWVLAGGGLAARCRFLQADASARRCWRPPSTPSSASSWPGCWCAIAFPGKRIVDALVDLPFALPTAVAGIALTALYAKNGWIGQYLEPLGIKVAFTPLGVLVALIFIGLPFVVRTVQPVLEDLDTRDRGGRRQPGRARAGRPCAGWSCRPCCRPCSPASPWPSRAPSASTAR